MDCTRRDEGDVVVGRKGERRKEKEDDGLSLNKKVGGEEPEDKG
jgi:hypothetical protein